MNEVNLKYRDHEDKMTEGTSSRRVHADNFVELAEEFKKASSEKVASLNKLRAREPFSRDSPYSGRC
jgi:hypothetical protein